MPKAGFSFYNCRSILKKGGPVMVSDEAVEELQRTMERIAFEISRLAALFADDAARRKVSAEDVRNATKEFLDSRSQAHSS